VSEAQEIFLPTAISVKFWQKYTQKFQSNISHTLICSATFAILESLCQLWNDTQVYKRTFICSWSLKPECKTVCTSMVLIQWFNCVQNNSTSHILYKFWQLWNGLGITSTVITAYWSSQTKVKLLTRCVIKCPSWQECLKESSLKKHPKFWRKQYKKGRAFTEDNSMSGHVAETPAHGIGRFAHQNFCFSLWTEDISGWYFTSLTNTYPYPIQS